MSCPAAGEGGEMPVTVARRGGRWRVVEKTPGGSKIAKNAAGTAADGGGHESREQAERQARAINRSLHKRGKI